MPGLDCVLGGFDVEFRAVLADDAPVAGVGPEDEARRLGAPGAHQTGKAEDLALM